MSTAVATKKIGIVGAGIAGLGAALALGKHHDVTVFEAKPQLGGHSHTARVDCQGLQIDVDTGFIVFAPPAYPNLTAMFDWLGVETQQTSMSISVINKDHLSWGSVGPFGPFGNGTRLNDRRLYLLIGDFLKFIRLAERYRPGQVRESEVIGAHLTALGFSTAFLKGFVMPFGSAIWSMAPADVLEFPARSFIEFFVGHQLAKLRRMKWRTVTGGSRRYVEKLAKRIQATVHTGTEIKSVRRAPDGFHISDGTGHAHQFDEVILACHSDEALAILDDRHVEEREALAAIPFNRNRVILHRDTRLMPEKRSMWASWNCFLDDQSINEANPVALTYNMNQLQGLDPAKPIFVTLNPHIEPRRDLIFKEYAYSHPHFSIESVAAQKRLQRLQGRDHIWFAGAYTGYGFHEAGLTSGLEIAAQLDGKPPWQRQGPSLN